MDKPWSYSALTAFETCPRQYYHVRVVRDTVEPPSEHLTWGNAVHKAFELRVSEGAPFPTGMEQWEPIARRLTVPEGDVLVEAQVAMTKSLVEVDWFAPDVWVRAVLDYVRIKGNKGLILDYKTGKRKDDKTQTELFAAVAMAKWPVLERVYTGFVWLKDKVVDTQEYTRENIPAIWGSLLPRVTRLQQAYQEQTWPARPSGLCRKHCAVTTCEHNGRYGL